MGLIIGIFHAPFLAHHYSIIMRIGKVDSCHFPESTPPGKNPDRRISFSPNRQIQRTVRQQIDEIIAADIFRVNPGIRKVTTDTAD